MVSTPTIAGASRIEAAYLESDQRRYWVPCPDCGEAQVLKWANVRWPKGKPMEAAYACEACGVLIANHRKPELLARGEWRAEATGDGRTAGFHLSSLYSPWQTWGECAVEFLESKDTPDRLKTWVNLVLGETFAERGEAPEWRRLYDRREAYKQGAVPAGGLFMTAGADVQPDRIEVEIVAWGPRGESWSVDYRVIQGRPFEPAVWRDLAALLSEAFPHALGKTLTIGRLAIDSGFATQEVYAWARGQSVRQVMAVKGVDTLRTALGAPSPVDITVAGRKVSAGLKMWPLGVSVLKHQLYGQLRQDPPTDEAAERPPGHCHFPEYAQEFFEQLCAEQLMRRVNKRGFNRWEWSKTRPRNEALDCRVYAMAAAEAAGLPRWRAETWAALAAELRAEAPPAAMRTVIPSKWLGR
jgi:phage terminase large subunit GpA-like protein